MGVLCCAGGGREGEPVVWVVDIGQGCVHSIAAENSKNLYTTTITHPPRGSDSGGVISDGGGGGGTAR